MLSMAVSILLSRFLEESPKQKTNLNSVISLLVYLGKIGVYNETELRMNMVYVIQNVGGKNIDPAKVYGRIHILLTGKEEHQKAITTILTVLSLFRDEDYLLLIGNPIYIGVACHVVLMKHKQVNLLVWNKQHYEYDREVICL